MNLKSTGNLLTLQITLDGADKIKKKKRTANGFRTISAL